MHSLLALEQSQYGAVAAARRAGEIVALAAG